MKILSQHLLHLYHKISKSYVKSKEEKCKYKKKKKDIILSFYRIFLSAKPTYFVFLKLRHHPEYTLIAIIVWSYNLKFNVVVIVMRNDKTSVVLLKYIFLKAEFEWFSFAYLFICLVCFCIWFCLLEISSKRSLFCSVFSVKPGMGCRISAGKDYFLQK